MTSPLQDSVSLSADLDNDGTFLLWYCGNSEGTRGRHLQWCPAPCRHQSFVNTANARARPRCPHSSAHRHPHLCPCTQSFCIKTPVKAPGEVWLSGLNAGLQTKESAVRFPDGAHAWVGQVPSGGRGCERQPHIDVSLPLSPFLSLKINKFFKKKKRPW